MDQTHRGGAQVSTRLVHEARGQGIAIGSGLA